MTETWRYGSAPSRRTAILDHIRDAGYAAAGAVAADLGVSERTVRRDMQRLAEAGDVVLVPGGASLPSGARRGIPFPERSTHRSEQKQAIAGRALAHIDPGTTIALDAGTTTLELARTMPAEQELTVVTHSLPAMSVLGQRSDLSLIGVGGMYNTSTMSFGGPETRATIAALRAHTLFLAATALASTGVYCTVPYDAETKHALLEIADRVVLLADSSKLGATAPVLVCPYDRIQTVITDDAADPEQVAFLREHVHVDVAARA